MFLSAVAPQNEGMRLARLRALDVLDTVTAAICYRNNTCSLALTLNCNLLVHTNYD